MATETETTTKSVELSAELIERVERRLPRTEWHDSGEYVEYVLEEVLSQVEAETENSDFEAVDEDEVKDRLESLGYLNE